MKPLALALAAGMLAIAGNASAHSYGYSISYGPRYYPSHGGYFYPRYYYRSHYSYAPYYYRPRAYAYYAPPPVVYYYPPPPPRVVYVERYVEAPPPPQPRPAPRVEPKPQASIPPPMERFERRSLSAKELFDFDRAVLKTPQPKLDEIAEVLQRNPQISGVRITGYTDRLGTDSYNQRLSERRAQAVKDYLVAKGVEPSRLTAVGRGESNPVVQCGQRDQAALIRCLEPNRRVEIEEFTVERRITEPARRSG